MLTLTDDPVADAERYAAKNDEELEKLPVCADCGEHIQDEYAYFINDEWICERCMENYRRVVEIYG